VTTYLEEVIGAFSLSFSFFWEGGDFGRKDCCIKSARRQIKDYNMKLPNPTQRDIQQN